MNRSRRTLSAAWIALAVVLGAASHARAEGPSLERAQSLFRAGAQAYELGDFKGAALVFEEAYRSAPRPGILFSIAQAHKKQFYIDKDPAELRAAIAHYHAYLEKSDAGPHRADAAQALGELEPLAARLPEAAASATPAQGAKARTRVMVSSATEGAAIRVDGGAPHPSPLILDVPPGKHAVRVVADGYIDDQRDLLAVEGVLVAVDVALDERRARLDVRASSGAEVTVDGRLVGRTPLATPLELAPARHFVAVTRNGTRPFSVELELARGEQRTLDVDLPRSGQRVAAWVMLATAAAGAIVGGVFTGVALHEQSVAESSQRAIDTGNVAPSVPADYRSASSARDDDRRIAGVALGGAAALALGGFALYLFDTPRAPTPPTSDGGGTPRAPRRAPLPIEVGAAPNPTRGFETALRLRF